VSLEAFVAALLFVGVLAYAVLAGADFGSGLWDLTAGGDERGAPLRTLVDHVIGPVWEANHVWLVYVLVFLWTGFPAAFAALCTTMYVPLSLAGLGIVARGSAFAFRKLAPGLGSARLLGALFAASSVVTPFLLGCVVGGVVEGRVPLDGHGDPWTAWTAPTSLAGGLLAVLTCAFLAATFLTAEAGARCDAALAAWCRTRALASGAAAGTVALVAIPLLHDDAPILFHGLTHRALPLLVASALAGLSALGLLWRRRHVLARVAAVGAVGAVVVGWGVAQYPWILVGRATLHDAAAPHATLWGLVVVVGLAAVLVLPPLAYLFTTTQRGWWVRPEAAPSAASRAPGRSAPSGGGAGPG
jgi:cytochrome d ubiquinol oxidase subunit II